MKNYFVYILTNKNNSVLYTGVTNSLMRRIWEHKSELIGSFTKKYNVTKLVYYEVFDNPSGAIKREKQIKAGSRKKKIELLNKINPDWKDLYNFDILYSEIASPRLASDKQTVVVVRNDMRIERKKL